MIQIDENILESSETNFIKIPPYVFDVDHVAKIRSELSITVLEKKKLTKLSVKKMTLLSRNCRLKLLQGCQRNCWFWVKLAETMPFGFNTVANFEVDSLDATYEKGRVQRQ